MDTALDIGPDPLIAILAEGAVYLALLVFIIYATIYGYHWFQYGSSKRTSWLALVVFLGGGGLLLLGLLISWQSF